LFQTAVLESTDGEVEVAELEIVPASVITRMELATAGISPDAESAALWAGTYYVRAVTWNGAGELIFGAPVTWSATRMVTQVGADAGLPGGDYALLKDLCHDPVKEAGGATSTVTASLGLLSASKSLSWTVRDPGDAEQWAADAACSDGCGCVPEQAPAAEAAGAVGVGLLGWAVVRRRAQRAGRR